MVRLAFVFLLAMSVLVQSHNLSIKVLLLPDTIAVGTNVTVLHDGVELFTKKADKNGIASFEVPSGSYFVILKRGGYPTHVNLLNVEKDTEITLFLRNQISYGGIYGQIRGPQNFSNVSISVYSGQKLVKKFSSKADNTPNKDGYFFIQYLPEGEYRFVFDAPGFVSKEEEQQIFEGQFNELNVFLEKEKPAEEPKANATAPAKPTLVVSSDMQKYSKVTVTLSVGNAPLPGKQIIVKTPAGNLELTTSDKGQAFFNAAEAGTYVVSYEDINYTFFIQEDEKPSIAQPPAVQEQASSQPKAEAAEESQASIAIFGLAAGMIFIFMAITVVVLWQVLKKGKHKRHKR
ncbi:MAG: carboxypeptidase-like regulatory domain-containing protein [Candidatus Micrarchaeota archaeon]|nr:carboxypeptidase-like regulatory domain-containing protein [Candidatus Micrarchaeota archaeon]